MKLLIAIPAYNEEKIIRKNVLKLYYFCKEKFSQHEWKIVVADNNSKDNTKKIVFELLKEHGEIQYLFIPQKGKGGAIRAAWEKFEADIYCFMDADLATDLSALPALISAIEKEGYDISCGSRYIRGSKAQRSFLRKITSLGYRFLLKFLLGVRIKDAPCGFKAINKRVKESLLPLVQNNEWFFDSELVILAEKKGYKIKEIPVIWKEETGTVRESRVRITALISEYMKNIVRARRNIQ